MEHRRIEPRNFPPRWLKQGLWPLGLTCLALAAGCSGQSQAVAPRNLTYYQEWAMQPGDSLAGYLIQSGLGDVSVRLDGDSLFMPFDGKVQPQAEKENLCIILSSPDVPAYLFRLCGVRQPHLGERRQGETIGTGEVVAFATLRRQADGTWAMVEPAKELIEQFLTKAP